MKMRKNKGKIHPSPSQSPSSSMSSSIYPPNQNALSILTLLPAAIIALISVLSIEDKEVFAYMVRVNNPSSSIAADQEKSKKRSNSSKKLLLGRSSVVVHEPPVFDCECFDCYKSYWIRWNSSPNGELIHKAIEEFEKHLFSQEQVKKSNKGRKREKIGRLGKEKAVEERKKVFEESFDLGLPENEVLGVGMLENEVLENEVLDVGMLENEVLDVGMTENDAAAAVVVEGSEAASSENKGFVRKVLPDVVGILNSRLWGLWNPNV